MNFSDTITKNNAAKIADFILDNFGPTNDENRLLDYDFNLKNGKMVASRVSNTVFAIDFPETGVGRDIIKVISDETIDVTDEMKNSFVDFLKDIIANLDERKEELTKKLSIAAFGKEMPIASIKIDSVLLMDLPEIDYTITVNKYAIKGYASDPVSKELLDEHVATGDDFDVILQRKKQSGELKYMLVDNVVKKKAIYECELRMNVDYSLPEIPESNNCES